MDDDKQKRALVAAYMHGFEAGRQAVCCRATVFGVWPYQTAQINTPAVSYYSTMRLLERYPELLFLDLIENSQKV